MRKIILLMIAALSMCISVNAAEPGADWWGQNGTWTSDGTTNALKCDATTNWGGANNWIATTFGTSGPWKDMTVKFDFYMPNSGNAIIWQFGQAAGDWAAGGVKVQFNIYGVYGTDPSWANSTLLLDANYGSSVYKYKLGGWNTAVINISAAGVVSVKLNGVNATTTFTPANALTLNGDFCSVNYQYSAGNDFQMRNVAITIGAVSKKYFTATPTAYTNMNMFSTTNAWFPVSVPEAVGPDNTTGGWYTVSTPGAEKIKFDGTITPTLTGIRTEKAALTDEWWGTTIKFKAEVDAAGGTTTYKVGSNGVWNTRVNGGRCIMLNVNKYEIQIMPEHEYGEAVQLWAWNSTPTYAPYSNSGPFDFEINISDATTHTITVKINGVTAPVIYDVSGVGVNRLSANGPMYFEVYPGASTFIFSNCIIKKGQTAKSYFPTSLYAIAATSNDVAKGTLTGTGSFEISSNVTLVATPTSGNHFVNWTETGSPVSANATYTFEATANKTLVANFEPNTVAVNSGTNNVSTIGCTTCDVTVAAGAELSVNSSNTLKSITAAPGAKLTIAGGTLNVTNGITLQSDATGTATFVDINNSSPQAVVGTVQQYLASARNWYLSSPIEGATVPAGQTYYSYNEAGTNIGFVAPATAYWLAVPQATVLNPIKGYIAQPASATTKSFTGTLNTGTYSIALTRTGLAIKPGFNLVSNPYPSYLDWSMVDTTTAKISSSVWYRTKTSGGAYTFDTYNGGLNVATANGVNTVSKLIPPMQSFWVRVKSGFAGGTLTVNNTMRKHADVSGNKMKMPQANETKVVRIKLSNGTNADETLICFNENAQNTLDNYDSPKMMNESETIPDLYTKVGTEKLVINGLTQVTDNFEVPLGFATSTAGNFTFKATELSNFDSNTRVYLRDKKENAEIELTPAAEYNFSSTLSSNNESRFSILFKAYGANTGLENNQNNGVSVFANAQNEIVIHANQGSKFAIYNAVGQQIAVGKTTSNIQTSNFKLINGIYVVKVNNVTERVIIK